jgi:hypothetical protein
MHNWVHPILRMDRTTELVGVNKNDISSVSYERSQRFTCKKYKEKHDTTNYYHELVMENPVQMRVTKAIARQATNTTEARMKLRRLGQVCSGSEGWKGGEGDGRRMNKRR